MRFTKETGLMQVLKYSSQRLARILTVPVTNGYRKLRRVLNPNGFTTRVMSDVRKGGKDLLTGKPQSLADYLSVGNYYVAKKLVFILAVLAFVLPVLYLKFLHPVIRANFLTVPMVVNSAEMTGYTGKVELLSAESGTVLYRGPLSEGRITGEGKLYDYEGRLVYQGGFLMEQYEGSGQSFWPNGNLQYVGGFSANRYEGRGVLYAEDGTLLYEGDFVNGLYEGEGTLYQDGAVLYQGAFKAGQMEGQGKLFDADTGELIYEGGFYNGVYEGEGALYDPATGLPLYQGSFRAGRYDGEGVEYDENTGAVVYKGEFLLGAYHGEGTQYDPATGFVTAAGQYRNGLLAGTEGGAVPEGGGQTGTIPDTGGQTGTTPDTPGGGTEGGGTAVYLGPVTADGGVDFSALADMTPSEASSQFSGQPGSWTMADGSVLVYSDQTEGIGLAIRSDSAGNMVSVDVWNDAPVAGGAQVGMTQAALTAALGEAASSTQETMGEGRMISISQSNRYFGRLTNLSPESKVTVYTYQTDSGAVRAVFAAGTDQCLLLEVLP